VNRAVVGWIALALAAPIEPALAQSLNARRMGMGGVMLPFGGSANESNVAYRAVETPPGSSANIPVPIGLIALAKDPPVLDPEDPDFNLYEFANMLYNPPWNLQLVAPEPPSSDIVVELGRNHLSVELGEVSQLFPDRHSRLGLKTHTPPLGFGWRGFFTGASALVEYRNELSLNEPLHAALARGEAFLPSTDYALEDDAHGQAAAAVQLGWAGAIRRPEQPSQGGFGLYTGVRAKLLRGLAYGDADNVVSFTTGDTLFSSSAIDLQYAAALRSAGPGGGGWGRAFDVGAVCVLGRLELGVGVNDLASRLRWTVDEEVAWRDSATGEIERLTVGRDVPFASELPVTLTTNGALRLGRLLVAADAVHGMGNTVGHAGAELWLGSVAVRGGGSLDESRALQFAGGLGLRIGPIGVDAGVATHARNLTRERAVELGVGLSVY
jgi:hypothetical protein